MDPTIAPALLPDEALELASVGAGAGPGTVVGANVGSPGPGVGRTVGPCVGWPGPGVGLAVVGTGAGAGAMQAKQDVSVGTVKPEAHEHVDAPALEE